MWVVTLATLLVGATAALGAEVPLPGPVGVGALAPGAPPAPDPVTPSLAMPAPVPAPAPALVPAPIPAVPSQGAALRVGAFGDMVRDLQRELRRHGLRIEVDGAFGRSTRAAVKRLQKRFRMRATGVAEPELLARLGIPTLFAASTPAAPALLPLPTPVQTGRARAGSAPHLRAFPVQGRHTYYDDFGEPRGRQSHQGNDIMAGRGTPVVAVADGTIKRLTRTETGLGGFWIWLIDTAGTTYYYAHLDTIAEGLQDGGPVALGQVIATVGNTGDARYGAPHLHFEIHPGDAGAVDPYRELLSLDPSPPVST